MKTQLIFLLFFAFAGNVFSQDIQVKKKKGKYGFLKAKEVVLDYQFDDVKHLEFDRFLVLKGDFLGLVENGVVTLACEYDAIDLFETNSSEVTEYLVEKNNKFGIYAYQKLQVPCVFDEIEILEPRYKIRGQNFKRHYLVKDDGKVGVYLEDKQIVPCEFESIEKIWSKDPSLQEFTIIQDGKYGFYKDGTILLPCTYDDLRKLREDRFKVVIGKKAGIVDAKNEVILPIQYENVQKLDDDVATVKVDGEWKKLDLASNEYLDDEVVFKVVQRMPHFKGCEEFEDNHLEQRKCANRKMLEYIYRNLKYPDEARSKGVEGTAVIRFTINRMGSIDHAEIVRDIGSGCGEEALRVVNSMPDWVPGEQDGQSVSVQFNLPIRFKL